MHRHNPVSFASFFLALLLLFFIPLKTFAETTHVVNVGVEGSFFTPPTLSAGLNDTVLFVFGGDIHSVTQSSFSSPCIRLTGGFDSGFNGRGPNFDQPAPVWALTIVNVSERACLFPRPFLLLHFVTVPVADEYPPPAIWFFCQASQPTSHCASGMVGVINPPSIAMYQQFVSAAKLVTGTPKPSPSFIASGQGAFATAAPMPSSIPLSDISSASFTSPQPPSPTSTSPDNDNASDNHRTTIIAGCVTAGGTVLLIVLVIAILYYRRSRYHPSPPSAYHNGGRASNEKSAQQQHPRSPGLASTDSSAATALTHSSFTRRKPPPADQISPYLAEDAGDGEGGGKTEKSGTGPTTTDDPHSTPMRGIRPLPRTPSQNQLLHQQQQLEAGSGGDSSARSVSPSSSPEPQQQTIDLNALAMEVASVLLSTPPRPGARQPPPPPAHRTGNKTRDKGRGRSRTRGGGLDLERESGSGWYATDHGEYEYDGDDASGSEETRPPHYRARMSGDDGGYSY
ncbi:hypothetical protein R3P38DRAFT_3483541 [Favolaschia claudopus]|uniref:Membrane-associated protein n=1 Tax=Favolaschia claudopus TaxID=2862362 RepID=A0AAW0C9Z8_9AGAR